MAQVPVADVERAKAFYSERLGFAVDFEGRADDAHRFVQLTPPGSEYPIQLAEGHSEDMAAGSLRGLIMVVPNVRAATPSSSSAAWRTAGWPSPRTARRSGMRGPGDTLDEVGFVHFSSRGGVEGLAPTGWNRSYGERSSGAAPPVRHLPKMHRSAPDTVKTLKVIEYSPVRTER